MAWNKLSRFPFESVDENGARSHRERREGMPPRMVNRGVNRTREGDTRDTGEAPKVRWSSEDQGWIFAAFNAGLLCMLVTGWLADKLNAKYMIIGSVLIASFANFVIPVTATLRLVLIEYE